MCTSRLEYSMDSVCSVCTDLRPHSQILGLRVYNMPTDVELADRVYLWQTVSTDHRLPSPCTQVSGVSGSFFG